MLAVAAMALLILQTDAATGSLAWLLQLGLILGLVVSASASIAAMLTAFSVGERVRALLSGAEAAAEGNLDQYVPFRTQGDEVDRLADSFNRMTAELRHLVESERLARREAEAASDAKSQFLSSMSHEIRTPLTFVLGYADILEETAAERLSAQDRAYIRKMQEAAEHLLAVSNDALDISRVESGQMAFSSDQIDLGEVVRPLLDSVGSLTTDRNTAFRFDVPSGVVVAVDAFRLRQILYNLLSNAVKFTPEGGKISFRASVHDDTLMFEVEDTGIGIAPEHRERVFRDFERIQDKALYAPGAGLGLALSKRLVDLHGGTIDFVSAPGEGTIFTVRLPGVVMSPSSIETPDSGGRDEESEKHPDRRFRILIVDDEPDLTELFTEMLRPDEHDIVVAHDGHAAEALATAEPFDLVLLDIRMPGMRGDELCSRLRAHGLRTPIVALSADAMPAQVAAAVAAGFDAYLSKPISASLLRTTVHETVERYRTIEQAIVVE